MSKITTLHNKQDFKDYYITICSDLPLGKQSKLNFPTFTLTAKEILFFLSLDRDPVMMYLSVSQQAHTGFSPCL